MKRYDLGGGAAIWAECNMHLFQFYFFKSPLCIDCIIYMHAHKVSQLIKSIFHSNRIHYGKEI